jgi:hypothetical protein
MNATNYASEAATNVAEPSMDELMKRLAALREDIRRARQRYGIDERNSSDGGAGALSGNGGET